MADADAQANVQANAQANAHEPPLIFLRAEIIIEKLALDRAQGICAAKA